MAAPAVVIALLLAVAAPATALEQRMLYDFEDPAELEGLRARSENVDLAIVQDNGVTHGRTCCRVVFRHGGDYDTVALPRDRLGGWSGYSAIAFDVFQDGGARTECWVELWDGASHDYASRCTITASVHPGRNTIVVPIDRAKRNGKEGRDWDELQPQDRIDLAALTQVKVFMASPTGADLVWWIDQVRLLPDAALAGPRVAVDLPPRAKAFAFGRATADVGGFVAVPAGRAFDGDAGIVAGAPEAIGKGWPDALAGRALYADGGWSFAVALPDGDYRAWLCGGAAIDERAAGARFRLAVGDEAIADETPDAAALRSERWLFRFLPTRYSQRPHALWLDYVDRMYPTWERRVTVRGGRLVVSAERYWLSALVVAPAAEGAAFDRFVEQARAARIAAFEATLAPERTPPPAAWKPDGAAIAFIPDDDAAFAPALAPGAHPRAAYDVVAAAGERPVLRLALRAAQPIGECRLQVSPLAGPTTIPAAAARVYAVDYRMRGDGPQVAALEPRDRVDPEPGVTWGFCVWLAVPCDAPSGDYRGEATLTSAGATWRFPIALRVPPVRLGALDWSMGLYYAMPPDARAHREQLAFLREIGFTATSVPPGRIDDVDGGSVHATFDADAYRRVRDAGFGATPRQYQMGCSLPVARELARRGLGLGARVDQEPGCEMKDQRMKPLYQDYVRRYLAFVATTGLPVAMEIVDEPREVPNPWNRGLEDTDAYADWMREAGGLGFVTAMGDASGARDYTSLLDHVGIISTHAGASSRRLITRALERRLPLWLYNIGMDRFSWGFYPWRVGAVGRWEWHFSFSEHGGAPGYPNVDEWMNPFTDRDGAAIAAPATYPGSMLFKPCFFDMAEGIRDAIWLASLDEAMRGARGVAAKRDALARADAFVAELRAAIPLIADVRGLAGADTGALVGQGVEGGPASRCDAWRRRCGELLAELQR